MWVKCFIYINLNSVDSTGSVISNWYVILGYDINIVR